MALGAIAELSQAGLRIPEDVAVTGFDDSAAATIAEPPLTTMHIPFEESALEAVSILDDLMEGRAPGASAMWCSPLPLCVGSSA